MATMAINRQIGNCTRGCRMAPSRQVSTIEQPLRRPGVVILLGGWLVSGSPALASGGLLREFTFPLAGRTLADHVSERMQHLHGIAGR